MDFSDVFSKKGSWLFLRLKVERSNCCLFFFFKLVQLVFLKYKLSTKKLKSVLDHLSFQEVVTFLLTRTGVTAPCGIITAEPAEGFLHFNSYTMELLCCQWKRLWDTHLLWNGSPTVLPNYVYSVYNVPQTQQITKTFLKNSLNNEDTESRFFTIVNTLYTF